MSSANDSRVTIKNTKGHSEFIVDKSIRRDTKIYRIEVSNTHGKDTAIMEVVVMGELK